MFVGFVSLLICLVTFTEGFNPTTCHYGTTSRLQSAEQHEANCLLSPRLLTSSLHSTAQDNDTTEKPCFWRPTWPKSQWQQRLNLKDLKVGQKLQGYVVEELLEEAKTGPKLFFECGVGRTNGKGDWNIVNGMMRLKREKISVVQKRAARYKKKDAVDLYVSRVQTGCGRLEVTASLEDAELYQKERKKIPVTSLQPNQEVQGTVVRLVPYGAFVDVGANRLGLLHIQKVADLYARFINKEEGLKWAGLEPGAKVRLMVESIKQRKLALDFTPDVKEGAAKERAEQERAKKERKESAEKAKAADTVSSVAAQSQTGSTMSAEELAQWEEYATQGEISQSSSSTDDGDDEDDDYDDDDDDEDDYDEDRDIEDSLGLGFY